MLRIISLNPNGIRSAWSKNLLPWVVAQAPDIVCLQELKAQLPDLAPAALGKRVTADAPAFTAEHLAAGRGGCLSRKDCEQNDRACR